MGRRRGRQSAHRQWREKIKMGKSNKGKSSWWREPVIHSRLLLLLLLLRGALTASTPLRFLLIFWPLSTRRLSRKNLLCKYLLSICVSGRSPMFSFLLQYLQRTLVKTGKSPFWILRIHELRIHPLCPLPPLAPHHLVQLGEKMTWCEM